MRKLILAISLVALTSGPVIARAAVSDRINAGIVRDLVSKNIWDDSFDQVATPAGKSLADFMSLLERNQSAALVDNVFSFENGAVAQNLYRTKIAILRSHHSYPIHAPLLLKRYTDGLLHAIKLSGVPEFEPIVGTFRQALTSGRLTLTDLSPSERLRLSQSLGDAHGVSVTDQDAAGYVVNGLYHDQTGTFGVDISRPVTDTLITFTHELVHVGHPDVLRARAEFPALQTQVQKILERWSKTSFVQLPQLMRILSFELNQADIQLLQRKISELRLAPKANTELRLPVAPTADEETTIRAWADSLIALTVASEFHAYGLSLSLYANLKDRLNLLPPSPRMRQYLNALMLGDAEFARILRYQGLSIAEKREFLDSVYAKLSQEGRTQLDSALNRVQGLYLQRFDEFLRTTTNRYSSMLKSSSVADAQDALNVLPAWARPGGYDSPLNPYSILLEKVSTAQIYRMKKSLDWASTQLKTLNSTLLAFRTGILDFNDVTLGELRLIGFASSQFTLPLSVQQAFSKRPDLMADVDSIPVTLQAELKKLDDGNWCRTSFCTVSSQSVISRYIALRLLRAKFLASDLVPVTSTHQGGIRVMMDKLDSGFVEADLTPERAQLLKAELAEQYRDAALLPDQVQWLRALLFSVVNFHQASMQVELRELATRFDALSRRLLTVLSEYGHDATASPQQIESQIAAYQAQFSEQLAPFMSECSKSSFRLWKEREMREALKGSGGQFTLGETQFLPSILCHNSQLYLVRQPGDYLASLPTIVSGGQIVSSMLVSAQPIQLVPALTLNPNLATQKKRSSGFWGGSSNGSWGGDWNR